MKAAAKTQQSEYLSDRRSKRKNLKPTDNQGDLLSWIRKTDGITFEESLGFDWRYLGGLLARGYLTWKESKSGHAMLAAVNLQHPKKLRLVK